VEAQKVMSGRKTTTAGVPIKPMDEDEAVSKTAHPEDTDAQPTDPMLSQTSSHYSSASPTFAGTAGSNPAIGRTTALGENVPHAQELSRSQNIDIEPEIEPDEEEEDSEDSEDEWDNYWPPSPPPRIRKTTQKKQSRKI
jgi:hypothetical protein